MEYLFVKKYNTSFYLIRNNHYICELISIIIYLKSTNIFFKTSHKKTYIDKLNEEVLIQINNYGETSEGSTSYDAFVLELLFLGNIFGVLNKTSKIRFKKLYLSLCNISSSKGSLPPFGDVTLERAILLNPNENILQRNILFSLCGYSLKYRVLSSNFDTNNLYFMLFFGSKVLEPKEKNNK